MRIQNTTSPAFSPLAVSTQAAGGAAVDPAQATATHATSSSAAMHEAVTRALAQVAGITDPLALIQQLQIAQRDSSAGAKEVGIRNDNDRAKEAEKARQHAIKKAHEASGFLGLGGVLGSILKAASAAAAVAASACTGGAAAGLVIAGAALMLGGDKIAKGAADLGLISKRDAQWLSLGLQITGALLTFGSGFAGAAGTAAEGASTAAQTTTQLKQVADTVKATTSAVGAINDGAMAVGVHVRDGFKVDAKESTLTRDAHNDDANSFLEELKSDMALHGRLAQKLAAMRATRAEMQMTAVRTLA